MGASVVLFLRYSAAKASSGSQSDDQHRILSALSAIEHATSTWQCGLCACWVKFH